MDRDALMIISWPFLTEKPNFGDPITIKKKVSNPKLYWSHQDASFMHVLCEATTAIK